MTNDKSPGSGKFDLFSICHFSFSISTPLILCPFLAVYEFPIVGNLGGKRLEPQHLLGIMRLSCAVSHDHHLVAVCLVPICNSRWNLDQAIIVLAEKNLL